MILLLGLPALAGIAAPDTSRTEAPVGPASYVLDPESSLLVVQVFKDRDALGERFAHDHAMAAAGWRGQVTWDPADPGSCKVDVHVPVRQLVVDDPAVRRQVGLDGGPDDGDRVKIREHMLGEKQLDAESFPEISFRAGSCTVSGELVRVSGDFSMHGRTRPIEVPMHVVAQDGSLSASGTFELRGSDYGIEPFTVGFGAIRNQDEMKLTIRVTGHEQRAAARPDRR